MPINRVDFGRALSKLRESKGLLQKEVASRIPSRYADAASYGRIERGGRVPDRDTVIDVLVTGLMETDPDTVDRLLGAAGYAALSTDECAKLGLRQTMAESLASEKVEEEPVGFRPVAATCVLATLSIAVAATSDELPAWFMLVTSGLYAAMYSVSLLLENGYLPMSRRVRVGAIYLFGSMLISSVAALRLVAHAAHFGGYGSFWLGLEVFFASAVVQWFAVRHTLSPESVVEVNFMPLTGQAAHFKNTGYFLSVVVFFWLPPAQSVLRMEQDLSGGRADLVARKLAEGGLVSGITYPRPAWLWVILLCNVGVALKMGSHLLDNLRASPGRNRYLNLFYARALLYFTLSVICILWYTIRFDELEHLILTHR